LKDKRGERGKESSFQKGEQQENGERTRRGHTKGLGNHGNDFVQNCPHPMWLEKLGKPRGGRGEPQLKMKELGDAKARVHFEEGTVKRGGD